MAMRSTGTATVAFGLVAVPVKVYSATDPRQGFGFHLLCRCGARLKQQYACEAEGKVVAREDMQKGYEHQKGQFVTFAPEEVRSLEEAATGTIAIEEFVPAAGVDPVHLDKAHYLAPDKGGQKAYWLLAGAMRRAGAVAIARYAARGKDHVVALRAVEGGVVMQQVLRADEVRGIEGAGIPPEASAKVSDAEAQMADLLVASASSGSFDAGKYPDRVLERFEAAVAAKVAGATLPVVEEKKVAPVIDLMAALRASIASKAKAA